MPVDYAEMLLGGGGAAPSPPPARPPVAPAQLPQGSPDYAEMLLGGVKTPEPMPTQLRERLPLLADDPNAKGGPGWLTNWQVNTVDDPRAKLAFYAHNRFPDMPLEESTKLYRTDANGDLYYQSPDDGKLYREYPNTLGEKFSRFAMEAAQPQNLLPAAVGVFTGGMGTLPAMGLAAAAGGVGEVGRKLAGRVFGGSPPQTALQAAPDVAVSAATGALGEGVGRAAGSVLFKGLAGRNRPLVTALGNNPLPDLDPAATEAMLAQGKRYGVDLNLPQASGSRFLSDRFTLLGKMPQTSEDIYQWLAKQNNQVREAVEGFLNEISPAKPAGEAMRDLAGTANAYRTGLEEAREAVAFPVYKAAYEQNPTVDTKPLMEFIAEERKKWVIPGSLPDKRLAEIERMLTGGTTPAVPGEPGTLRLVTDLPRLNHLKMIIDQRLSLPDAAPSASKEEVRRFAQMKDLLVKQMDAVSPTYAQARAAFAQASEPINDLDRTITGTLAKKMDNLGQADPDRKIMEAARTMFFRLKPDELEQAATIIRSQNPEAWTVAIRTMLEDSIDSVRFPQSPAGDIGGKIGQRWFGSKDQVARWRAALTPEQFQNMQDFVEVLKRTSIGRRGASDTAAFLTNIGEMNKEALGGLNAPINIIKKAGDVRPGSLLTDWFVERMQGNYLRNLSTAILSPDATEQLAYLKSLPVRSPKLLKGAVSLLTTWAEGKGLGKYGTPNAGNNGYETKPSE